MPPFRTNKRADRQLGQHEGSRARPPVVALSPAPGVPAVARAAVALQSSAGNRLVSRMISAQREESETEESQSSEGKGNGVPNPGTSDMDRFVGLAKASKIGSAIAEAGKHSGLDLDKQALLPSAIRKSADDPEGMVKGAGSNWSKVKERYVSNEDTMRRILQYRIQEVGRVYKLVIAQMRADNEAVRKQELSKPVGERDMSRVFQVNDLQFSMMGSTDLTSDYDVSFDHVVTKPWVGATAVKLFNKKFRDKWGKESGSVFDTNVYTQGFMPQDMSNIPAGMPGAIEARKTRAEKRASEGGVGTEEKSQLQQLAKRLESEAEKAKQVRKEAALKVQGERSGARKGETARADVFVVEDVMSMVKLRKFMSDDEWREYRVLLLSRIPVKSYGVTAEVLEQADAKFKQLDKELQKMKGDLRNKKLRDGVDPGAIDPDDLELEASNRLYERYLDRALQVVQKSKNELQGKDLVQWTEEQSTALYFANEAYHTSGPVESTVIGQQMGIAMEQTSEQYLQAINEQTGFVVEQHHAAHGNEGKFLWKSAKYVDRICSIVESIKDQPKGGFKHYTVLKALSKDLLVIKKGSGSDAQKNEAALGKLSELAPGRDVKKMVLELNADLNQKLRRKG